MIINTIGPDRGAASVPFYTKQVTITTSGTGSTAGRAQFYDENVSLNSRIMISRIVTGASSVLLGASVVSDHYIQITAYNTDGKAPYNGSITIVYLVDNTDA